MALQQEIVKHIADGFDMRQVAEAKKIEVARIILEAVEKERDRQRELMERIVTIGNPDADAEIRTRLETIKTLNAVLAVPQEARSRVTAKEKTT